LEAASDAEFRVAGRAAGGDLDGFAAPVAQLSMLSEEGRNI
jgi:hypothetical protein